MQRTGTEAFHLRLWLQQRLDDDPVLAAGTGAMATPTSRRRLVELAEEMHLIYFPSMISSSASAARGSSNWPIQ